MEQSNLFNQHLQQIVSRYLASPAQVANMLLMPLVQTIRSAQANTLKPIIFYQLMMVIQTLQTTKHIEISSAEMHLRIKKRLAIPYNENDYVVKLTDQVIETILLADKTAQANPKNAALLNQLRGEGEGHQRIEFEETENQPLATFNETPVVQPTQQYSQLPRGPPPGPMC